MGHGFSAVPGSDYGPCKLLDFELEPGMFCAGIWDSSWDSFSGHCAWLDHWGANHSMQSSILVNILVYTIHLDHCLAICVMDSNIWCEKNVEGEHSAAIALAQRPGDWFLRGWRTAAFRTLMQKIPTSHIHWVDEDINYCNTRWWYLLINQQLLGWTAQMGWSCWSVFLLMIEPPSWGGTFWQ